MGAFAAVFSVVVMGGTSNGAEKTGLSNIGGAAAQVVVDIVVVVEPGAVAKIRKAAREETVPGGRGRIGRISGRVPCRCSCGRSPGSSRSLGPRISQSWRHQRRHPSPRHRPHHSQGRGPCRRWCCRSTPCVCAAGSYAWGSPGAPVPVLSLEPKWLRMGRFWSLWGRSGPILRPSAGVVGHAWDPLI